MTQKNKYTPRPAVLEMQLSFIGTCTHCEKRWFITEDDAEFDSMIRTAGRALSSAARAVKVKRIKIKCHSCKTEIPIKEMML